MKGYFAGNRYENLASFVGGIVDPPTAMNEALCVQKRQSCLISINLLFFGLGWENCVFLASTLLSGSQQSTSSVVYVVHQLRGDLAGTSVGDND